MRCLAIIICMFSVKACPKLGKKQLENVLVFLDIQHISKTPFIVLFVPLIVYVR